jgi:putative ABC transport system permease protein
MASPGYFDTIGLRLLKGRGFTDRDVASAPPVCVVNEEFVKRFLHNRGALDAVVKVPPMAPGMVEGIPRQIVGVVAQVSLSAGEKEKTPEIYVPLAQNAWYSTSIALKTTGSPTAVAHAARAAIARIDKDQAVTNVRPMDEVAAEATSLPRFRAALVTTLALLALGLAAVGIFAVLTFAVRERGREFGIRMALGARANDILRLVLANGAVIVGAGTALGVAGAAVLSRFLASLLYGVAPLDPVTFAAAPLVLAVTALAASVAPAVRAVRTDPAVTLKAE